METPRLLEASKALDVEAPKGPEGHRKASEDSRCGREGKEGVAGEDREDVERQGPHRVDQGLERRRLVRPRIPKLFYSYLGL